MGIVIFVAAVAAAALTGLFVSGIVGSLAARDWLWVSAVVPLSVLVGVLTYWGLLRGWVERRHHPFTLRVGAAIVGLSIFFLFVGVTFGELLAGLPSPSWVHPAVLYLLVLQLLLWGAFFAADRQHAELR